MRPDYQSKQSTFMDVARGAVPILLLVSIFFSIQSCGSSGTVQIQSAYPPPLVTPSLSVERGMAGDVVIDMNLAGKVADTSSIRFVRNVKSIAAVIIHPELGYLDTLKYQIAAGSQEAEDGSAQLILNAHDRWINAQAIQYDSLYVETLITLQDGSRYGDVQKLILPPVTTKQEPIPTITLAGSIEKMTDTSVLFIAIAERHRIIPQEYFPSGERLRVTILDGGSIVWSSELGQFFTQAISPVEPKFVAQVKRYEIEWNGKNRQGEPLPPGRYTVQLMLPVKPHPYSTTIPFFWNIDGE